MKLIKPGFAIVFILAIQLCFFSCTEIKEWDLGSDEMVITDYIISNDSIFSEFGAILKYTGIDNLLRIRGPYTLLAPTDDAILKYYSEMGVSSYEQIEIDDLKDLVYNHMFMGEISSSSIGQGALLYKNALGDFVASDFRETDILINKIAIIEKRDIPTANGYVHIIDHVLEPIVQGVYDELSTYDGYTIFLEGLERAGLKDTLNLIEFDYGTVTARARYTLLAVPDTLYARYGISDIDDLIDSTATGPDLTSKDNGFYQYMEYHCLSGSHYFNEMAADDIYHLISYDNYLNIKVVEDYKINLDDDGNYTGFYYEESNIPAKNGVIHTLNTTLPVSETKNATFLFQTTDYFDLQQGPYYLNYYQRFYDGENTFEGIKWDADFLLYYLKTAHNLKDDDCLNLQGHFSVEITTPKIRAGEYTVSGFFFFGGGFAIMDCYIDGEYMGVLDLTKESWGGPPIKFGDVNFTETKEHTIRLESIVPGGCFWDYVKFTPKL